jgi:hypothetical protein
MIKVVYNACYGGFGLSQEALKLLKERRPELVDAFEKDSYFMKEGDLYLSYDSHLDRHDPDLVAVVEELGLLEASGNHADLAIYMVDGDRYFIDEYDGYESVMTPSNIDWIVVE